MNDQQFTNDASVAYRPFDNLPNEILAMILTWVSRGLRDIADRHKFPLIPGAVSRRWKAVVDATPALWTTVMVDEHHPWLECYLKKSGNMPIHVYLSYPNISATLTLHPRRWETLIVQTVVDAHLTSFLETIAPFAISLLHFSAITAIDCPYGLDERVANVGLLSSSLRSLHLCSVALQWTPSLFVFPNLDELLIDVAGARKGDIDSKGLLATLCACPRLKRLGLFSFSLLKEDIISGLTGKGHYSTAELRNLEELVLVNFTIAEFLFLTSQISCPNLCTLGVDISRSRKILELEGVECGMLSPMYPHLKRLDILSHHIDPDEIRLALHRIKSISTLGIRGNGAYIDDERSIVSQNYVRCLLQLHELGPSVRTLQTRLIGPHALRIIIREFCPNTEVIQMRAKDIDIMRCLAGPLRFVDTFLGLPTITPCDSEYDVEECLRDIGDFRVSKEEDAVFYKYVGP
ncbi:hypothetical protein FRC02_001921 [Tulasnella sp. 418]|nr:hypothetical protein FRC02_001921 [Tulasnella sp. 418]